MKAISVKIGTPAQTTFFFAVAFVFFFLTTWPASSAAQTDPYADLSDIQKWTMTPEQGSCDGKTEQDMPRKVFVNIVFKTPIDIANAQTARWWLWRGAVIALRNCAALAVKNQQWEKIDVHLFSPRNKDLYERMEGVWGLLERDATDRKHLKLAQYNNPMEEQCTSASVAPDKCAAMLDERLAKRKKELDANFSASQSPQPSPAQSGQAPFRFSWKFDKSPVGIDSCQNGGLIQLNARFLVKDPVDFSNEALAKNLLARAFNFLKSNCPGIRGNPPMWLAIYLYPPVGNGYNNNLYVQAVFAANGAMNSYSNAVVETAERERRVREAEAERVRLEAQRIVQEKAAAEARQKAEAARKEAEFRAFASEFCRAWKLNDEQCRKKYSEQ